MVAVVANKLAELIKPVTNNAADVIPGVDKAPIETTPLALIINKLAPL